MTTPCVCRLNGLDPRDLDPAVIVTDVIEHAPAVERKTLEIAGRSGVRLSKTRLGPLRVTVRFELHDLDPARRRHLCRELARWATPGGYLTLGDRPGQRLRVTCDAPPVIGSTMGWTQPVTVGFTAWESPFWEDEAAVSAVAEAASGEVLLRPTGDLLTPVEALFLNVSKAVVNTLSFTAGGRAIRLTNLGMAPGETLTVDHDDRALLRLTLRAANGDERSAMALRDPASDDEALIPGRQNARVTFKADATVRATFTARGRWL